MIDSFIFIFCFQVLEAKKFSLFFLVSYKKNADCLLFDDLLIRHSLVADLPTTFFLFAIIFDLK